MCMIPQKVQVLYLELEKSFKAVEFVVFLNLVTLFVRYKDAYKRYLMLPA